MCTGFAKWRENTTTSPSGKHLDIFKALVKAMKYNILSDSEIKYNYNYDSTTSLAPIAKTMSTNTICPYDLGSPTLSYLHLLENWPQFLLEKYQNYH
jgi:hypothetical protein